MQPYPSGSLQGIGQSGAEVHWSATTAPLGLPGQPGGDTSAKQVP